MANKMTNVMALDVVLNGGEITAEVREKLAKMREQFAKKSSAERKPTAVQTANVGFKADILDFMVEGQRYTISDLMKSVDSIAEAELSNQRVSALVRQLVTEGSVIRTEEKRKAYFSLAE